MTRVGTLSSCDLRLVHASWEHPSAVERTNFSCCSLSESAGNPSSMCTHTWIDVGLGTPKMQEEGKDLACEFLRMSSLGWSSHQCSGHNNDGVLEQNLRFEQRCSEGSRVGQPSQKYEIKLGMAESCYGGRSWKIDERAWSSVSVDVRQGRPDAVEIHHNYTNWSLVIKGPLRDDLVLTKGRD